MAIASVHDALIVASDGVVVNVNSAVMCAVCPFFKAALDFGGSNQTVPLSSVSSGTLRLLVNAVYLHHCKVTNVLPRALSASVLLKVAEAAAFLLMPWLTKRVFQALQSTDMDMTSSEAFALLHFGNLHKGLSEATMWRDMQQIAELHIAKNIETAMSMVKFKNLPVESLMSVLQSIDRGEANLMKTVHLSQERLLGVRSDTVCLFRFQILCVCVFGVRCFDTLSIFVDHG